MKLVYFDAYGYAEPIRMTLAVNKQEFEDVRVKREDWPAYKEAHASELEFGQVPVLYHNGNQINQSAAILRYVSNVLGLTPTDAYQAWRVDSFVDAFRDLQTTFSRARFETDEEKKKQLSQEFVSTTLPAFLQRVENRIAANSNPHFIVGESLTIADF